MSATKYIGRAPDAAARHRVANKTQGQAVCVAKTGEKQPGWHRICVCKHIYVDLLAE